MSRIRLFRVLHMRQLTRQPVRVVLALVAVGSGVALTVAAALLLSSFEHAVEELQRDLAGPAELRVIGPLGRGGLDDAVTEKVAAVPGVEAAVPMVQAVTRAENRNGDDTSVFVIGVDCRVEALVGAFGSDDRALEVSRDGPVLVSSSFARELGEGARLRTNTGRVPIEGAAINDTLDDVNKGRIIVFDLRTSQRLFSREGRLDAIYVQPGAGVDSGDLRERVAAVVGDWNTVLLKGELSTLDLSTGPLLSILGLGVLLAQGLTALLVYNIVSLSLAARRRDLAVAAGVGVAPRTITSGILAEVGILGLAGSILGALAGVGFGAFMVAQASTVLVEQAFGAPIDLHLSFPVIYVGIALGTLTALGASYVPARRARRIDILAEIHGRASRAEETKARTMQRLAVLLLGAGTCVFLSYIAQSNGSIQRWQPPLGALAMVGGTVFLLATVGTLSPLLLRVISRPLHATGGPLRVAVSNLVANPRRTSVMAIAAAGAVGLACVLAATGPAIRGAVSAGYGASVDGRVWVSNLPANNVGNIEGRPSPELLKELAAVPGVSTVESGPCVTLANGPAVAGVCQHDGGPLDAFETVSGEVGAGALDRGEAIIGTGVARSWGLRPGSTMHVPTPTGFVDVRVAGIRADSNFNGYSLYVSRQRFESMFGDEPATAVLARPERGVSPEALARRIEAADLDPDLYALAPEPYVVRLADEVGTQVTPFWTLQRVLLVVALIAALSTLLLVGVQRRRELGVLGAVGFGPGALARMTVAEAAAAALAGGLLGVAASIGLFEAFRNVAAATVGIRPPFRFELGAAAVAVVLAVVVVSIGGVLPAWRTARLQIVEAIRDE